MKLILLLVISCLALHNGEGAPKTAVYKFVRCNPTDDKANCVTYQTPQMPWNPDLPAKLPASTAQYLEAEPEEGESPPRDEEGDYNEVVEEETPIQSEDRESPVIFPGEEGSGYEGSGYFTDFATAAETGSGEAWTADFMQKDEKMNTLKKLFTSRSFTGEPKPTEQDLKEDHLMTL